MENQKQCTQDIKSVSGTLGHGWRIEVRVRSGKADHEIIEDELFQPLHTIQDQFYIQLCASHELEVQVKDYISSASLQAQEVKQIYTVDKKIKLKQGEKLETKEPNFSINPELRRLHNLKRPSIT